MDICKNIMIIWYLESIGPLIFSKVFFHKSYGTCFAHISSKVPALLARPTVEARWIRLHQSPNKSRIPPRWGRPGTGDEKCDKTRGIFFCIKRKITLQTNMLDIENLLNGWFSYCHVSFFGGVMTKVWSVPIGKKGYNLLGSRPDVSYFAWQPGNSSTSFNLGTHVWNNALIGVWSRGMVRNARIFRERKYWEHEEHSWNSKPNYKVESKPKPTWFTNADMI